MYITVVSTVAGESSEADDNNVLPFIGAGIAVVVIFVGVGVLAVIIFIIWWKKQKREVKQTLYNPESPVRNKTNVHMVTVLISYFCCSQMLKLKQS